MRIEAERPPLIRMDGWRRSICATLKVAHWTLDENDAMEVLVPEKVTPCNRRMDGDATVRHGAFGVLRFSGVPKRQLDSGVTVIES